FIGHESPLQQSQSSQHEAVSLPVASFFFIGHESPLQQQQDIAVLVRADGVKANAAMPIPSTRIAKMLKNTFLFIFITS
ncbi:MAG: hypothetical protein ACRD43_03895, partial [Pyrinomonadaceae bacterium]